MNKQNDQTIRPQPNNKIKQKSTKKIRTDCPSVAPNNLSQTSIQRRHPNHILSKVSYPEKIILTVEGAEHSIQTASPGPVVGIGNGNGGGGGDVGDIGEFPADSVPCGSRPV